MSAETEVWTSMGPRVWSHSKGELVDTWLDETGREVTYKKFPGLVVGGLYQVHVDRTEGKTRVSGTADYTGQRTEENADRIAIWQAETLEARSLAARRRAERSLARKTDVLDEALEPVTALVVKCRSYNEFKALQATVSLRMMDAYDKRRS